MNVNEFVNAREKEIKAIEESIEKKNKKSLLFQRLPFYKRRRNRNYEKKSKKKFTLRKKDRHFLRSYTFYAKRFFMIKIRSEIENNPVIGIPWERRLKSSKFIYKSSDRGFMLDETFRGVYQYERNMFPEFNSIGIHFIDNEYDILVTETQVISIGKRLKDHSAINFKDSLCSISIIKNDLLEINKLEKCKVFLNSNSSGVETAKIICERTQIMNIFQSLINIGMIPISITELFRICLENDKMCIYDNINSSIYKNIEEAQINQRVEKGIKLPAGKRYGLYTVERTIIPIKPSDTMRYFVFKGEKGSIEEFAEIFNDLHLVGRVIRSAFKFSSGRVYGLGVLYSNFKESTFFVRNLGMKNYYQIEFVKYFA